VFDANAAPGRWVRGCFVLRMWYAGRMSARSASTFLRLGLLCVLRWHAVGVLATVVVAWGVSVPGLHTRNLQWEHVARDRWPVAVASGWPSCTSHDTVRGCGWVYESFEGTSPEAGEPARVQHWFLDITRSGWPFLGLRGWRSTDPVHAEPVHRFEWTWKYPGRFGYQREVAFPLLPLWPGFALNTLFYAVLTWCVWQIPLALRRRRRRRAGLCTRCGYDLKGIGAAMPCPECGDGARVRS
jgi:hypothetical protein